MTTDEARTPGEDTKALFFELAAHRNPGVRDQLVTAHLGLAHQLARRYANRGEPYEDLVQVASLAIVKSVDRFDPERGVEFTTFATRTVIGELKRHFRDKGWAVRAPRRIQELYLELGKITELLTQELGRSPTVAELASATGASEEAVLEALEAGQGYRTSSIDATDRNEETLASHIGGEDASLDTVEDRELLAPAIAKLPPREQHILQLRFAHGLTQSEIATRVGISQMHVSRLLAASLERLRKSVIEAEGTPDGADGNSERAGTVGEGSTSNSGAAGASKAGRTRSRAGAVGASPGERRTSGRPAPVEHPGHASSATAPEHPDGSAGDGAGNGTGNGAAGGAANPTGTDSCEARVGTNGGAGPGTPPT